MKLGVPTQKDQAFSGLLFNTLSESLIELKEETGKWPNRVTLTGSIGGEVHQYIVEMGWDLSKFGLRHLAGGANKITIDYDKPLNQIEDIGNTIFDSKLSNIEIKGIPSGDTMKKILGTYLNLSYTIERTVRPRREILLIRK
jgi:hypothetical protein